jgi:hypothetical protein
LPSAPPWRSTRAEPTLAAALELHEPLGDLLALVGAYDEARAQFLALLARLEDAGERAYGVRRAALLRKLGATYEQQGELETALTTLVRAARAISAGDQRRDGAVEHARIFSEIGWVHFRRNELDEAQGYLEQATALLEPLGADEELVRVLNRLGGVAWQRGSLKLAQHYVERSLEASRRSGDVVGEANALNNLSVLTATQGETERTIEFGEAALQAHEQVGSRRGMSIAANNLGLAYYNRDENEAALGWFAKGRAWAMLIGDTYMEMRARLNAGRALLMLDRPSDALLEVQQSLQIAQQLQLQAEEVDSHALLGELALREGDQASASLAFARASRLVEDEQSEEAARVQRLQALLLHAQGHPEAAATLLRASGAIFSRLHNVPETRRTQQLLASFGTPYGS